MTWTRLDDHFPDHPKILAAGERAELLHIHALIYCNKHLTDGFVSRDALKFLSHTPQRKAVQKLVELGIWHVVDGGYEIHHFLEWNPSRDRVQAERAATAARQSKWRTAKSLHNADSNASLDVAAQHVTNASLDGGLRHVTNTSPSRPVPSISSKSTSRDKTGLPEVLKKQTNGLSLAEIPEMTQEQIDIAIVLEECLGHQLSAIDLQACSVWLTEFRYLDGPAIIDRLRSHVVWCVDTNRHKPKTAAGFHETLRLENDHRADAGVTPQRTSQTSQFTKIGDVLNQTH